MAKLLSSQPFKQSREAWLSPRPYLLIFIWIFCIAGINYIMLLWRKYFKSTREVDYMLERIVNTMAYSTTEMKIEIEWNYTPPSYFEEQIICEREGYSIKIEDGHITAQMNADVFDSQPGFRDSLTQKLKDYFLGAQLTRRQPFEIHGGAINRVWPDGRRDTTLVVQSAVHKHIVGNVDLVLTDGEGVVHDTHRDRIDTTKNLSELSARHAATDRTARKMLYSFDAAVRDPENELVYLYEVWEALQTKFRGEEKARKALGILRSARSRLTHLANDEPLNQGRHRGSHAGSLRDATTDELDEAMTIDRDMIASYLNYLDEQQQHK